MVKLGRETPGPATPVLEAVAVLCKVRIPLQALTTPPTDFGVRIKPTPASTLNFNDPERPWPGGPNNAAKPPGTRGAEVVMMARHKQVPAMKVWKLPNFSS